MGRKGYHTHEYQDPLTFAMTTLVHKATELEAEDHRHAIDIYTYDGKVDSHDLGPARAWAELQPQLIKTDHARYPNAPCDHCRTLLAMYTPTRWVTPYCCKDHKRDRPRGKGGSISILCDECFIKVVLKGESPSRS